MLQELTEESVQGGGELAQHTSRTLADATELTA
jgi:hypothetical protein